MAEIFITLTKITTKIRYATITIAIAKTI